MLSSFFLIKSLLVNCTHIWLTQISNTSNDKNGQDVSNELNPWIKQDIITCGNIFIANKEQDNVGLFNNTRYADITLQESISSNLTQNDENQNINPILAYNTTEFHSSIPMQNTEEQFLNYDLKFPDFFGGLHYSTVYKNIESTLPSYREVQDSDLFDHDIEKELENIIEIPNNNTDDQVLAKDLEITEVKAETECENTLVLDSEIEYDMVQSSGVTVKVNCYKINLKNIDSTMATFYFSVYKTGNKKECYILRSIVYVKMTDILRNISDPKDLDVSTSMEYQYKLMKDKRYDLNENEIIYIENRINVCRQVFLDCCLFGWKSIASLEVVYRGVLRFNEIDNVYFIHKSYFNAIEGVSATKTYVLKRLLLKSNHYSGEDTIVKQYKFKHRRVNNLYK